MTRLAQGAARRGARAARARCAAQIEAGREYQRIEPPHAAARRPGGGDRVLLLRLPGVLPGRAPIRALDRGAPDYVAVRRVPALSTKPGSGSPSCTTARGAGQVERLHWPVYGHPPFRR